MDEVVKDAVEAAISDNPEVVEQWLKGAPKTWGYLAGRAVGTARGRAARNLTDEERRRVWAALWERLQAIGEARRP